MTPRIQASSWSTRLAAATGTLAAVALSPAAGKAAVVKVTGSPVSLSLAAAGGTSSIWDVDGDGISEFSLYKHANHLDFRISNSGGSALIAIFASSSSVNALNSSFNVGPTLASNAWGATSLFTLIMDSSGTIGSPFSGFGQGDNFFGFRFNKGGDMHYGYAVVNFDSPNETVTISRWAYNNVADGIAHVEAITANPSAVPGPIGLAGLAAGAAWTRKLRRRIKTAA